MRNLEECQAEVFRRSGKRMKECKQRRKHIVMVCIPLVLCISAFGAFVLPGIGSADPLDGKAPEISNEQYSGAMGTDVVGGLFMSSVTVSGNGISHYYTTAADVQGIINLIDSIVTVSETDEGDGSISHVTDETATNLDGDSREKEYKILIRQSDGSSAEYLLIGPLLVDQSTKKEFHMREDTCFALKDALGIPRS